MPTVLKSGSLKLLEPSGPVQACNGIALPFTTFKCRLSWNLGASNSWNPQGLSRPVMGLLYLIIFREAEKAGPCKFSKQTNLKNKLYCSVYTVVLWRFIPSFFDIWLAVHHSITFLLLPTWYTIFLFIHINYIKLNSSTCFERNPLIIRRSTT